MIKLTNEFLSSELFEEPRLLSVFLWLLIKANTRNKMKKGILVKRGQLLVSLNKVCDRFDITYAQMRVIIGKLVDNGEITKKPIQGLTLITICEYESYGLRVSEERQAVQTESDTEENIEIVETDTDAEDFTDSYYMSKAEVEIDYKEMVNTMVNQQVTIESFCKNNGITVDEFVEFSKEILDYWELKGQTHKSEKDAKEHLLNAMYKKLQYKKSNGYKKQQTTAEQRQAEFYAHIAEQLSQPDDSAAREAELFKHF